MQLSVILSNGTVSLESVFGEFILADMAQIEADRIAAQQAADSAAGSASSAQASASDAAASADSANASAATASAKAVEAANSAASALDSQSAAAGSAANAATSATNAASSATAAATSASNSAGSANAAASSATAAKTSQDAAAASATAANASKTAAATSATNAKTSETNAAASASTATTKAAEAATSATNAEASKIAAATSATNAATSATNAKTSETNAAGSATAAAASAADAAASAEEAQQAAAAYGFPDALRPANGTDYNSLTSGGVYLTKLDWPNAPPVPPGTGDVLTFVTASTVGQNIMQMSAVNKNDTLWRLSTDGGQTWGDWQKFGSSGYSGVYNFTAATSLTSEHAGAIIVARGTTYTLTLPSLGTLRDGDTVTVVALNTVGAVITVQCASGDSAEWEGSSSRTSWQIRRGDTLVVSRIRSASNVPGWGVVSDPANVSASSSMKNRLINGAFNIWQRGTSITVTGSPSYTADRWLMAGAGVNLSVVSQSASGRSYLRFSTGGLSGSTYAWAKQRIESINTLGFNESGFTFSIWVRSNANRQLILNVTRPSSKDNYTSEVNVATLTFSHPASSSVWRQYSIAVPPGAVTDDIGVSVSVEFPNGLGSNEVIDLSQAQVELGSAPTNFDDRGSNEIQLCQRYCFVIPNSLNSYGIGAPSASWDSFFMVFPTRMRTTPNLSFTDDQGTAGFVRFRSANGGLLSRAAPDGIGLTNQFMEIWDVNHSKSFFSFQNTTLSAEL